MKYQFVGTNVEFTDAIKDKIISKLEHLNKYFLIDDDVEARVSIRLYKLIQKVEVTIPTKFATLRVEVENEDLYVAIDSIVGKLEKQIRKIKTKVKGHNGDKISKSFALDQIENEDFKEDILIRNKEVILTPMTLDDAILQMNLLDHSFFVYKDIDHNTIGVVYRRKDGDYGLIDVLDPVAVNK